MEEEIEEKLQEIYNFKIEVEFKEFRHYLINCYVDYDIFYIDILYDSRATFNSNINNICDKIDNELVKLFKKVYN